MAVVGLKFAALYLFSKTLAFNHFWRLIQFPRLMTEAGHRIGKTDKNCGWEISKNQDSFKNPAKKLFREIFRMKKAWEEDLGRKENYPHDEKKKKAQVETDQSFFSKKFRFISKIIGFYAGRCFCSRSRWRRSRSNKFFYFMKIQILFSLLSKAGRWCLMSEWANQYLLSVQSCCRCCCFCCYS